MADDLFDRIASAPPSPAPAPSGDLFARLKPDEAHKGAAILRTDAAAIRAADHPQGAAPIADDDNSGAPVAGFGADGKAAVQGLIGPSAASELTGPVPSADTLAARSVDGSADRAAFAKREAAKPIQVGGEGGRLATKFWQRVRELGAGGGRAVEAGLEQLGLDPTGDAAQWLKDKATSGEAYAARPIEGGSGEPVAPTLTNIRDGKVGMGDLARFVLEMGAGAAPDMLTLATGAGAVAYTGMRAGETGQKRAVNDRGAGAEASGADVLKSLPSATADAVLGRLNLHGLFGPAAATVAGRIAQRFGVPALVGAAQAPIDYAGTNLGTTAGFDPGEAVDQSVAGAIAGGITGAIAGGIGEVAGRLGRRQAGSALAEPGQNQAGSADGYDPGLGPNDNYMADIRTGSVRKFGSAREAALYATSNKVADQYDVVPTSDGKFALRNAPRPAGVVETAAAEAATPTQADIDSPIPTDAITRGREAVARATASATANDALAGHGMPAIGKRVMVDMGNGRTATGTMADLFEHSDPDLGAAQGIRVALDDGTSFEEFINSMQRGGMSVSEIPDFTPEQVVAGANAMRDAAISRPLDRGDKAVAKAPDGLFENPAPATPDRLNQITRETESGGNEAAISPKGAKGSMQVMDATNRDPGYGVRPAQDDSPEERRRVGEEYRAALMKHYGDPAKMWAAYNGGPGRLNDALSRAKREGGDWLSYLPQETQDYVSKNMKKLGGGAGAKPADEPATPSPQAPAASGETTSDRIAQVTGEPIGDAEPVAKPNPVAANPDKPVGVGASVVQLTDKSVIVRGTTPEQDAAIAAALPAAVRPVENKRAGGMVYSAKHAPAIRAAIENAPAPRTDPLPVQSGDRIAIAGKDGSWRAYSAANASPTTTDLRPEDGQSRSTSVGTGALGEQIRQGKARILKADEPLPEGPQGGGVVGAAPKQEALKASQGDVVATANTGLPRGYSLGRDGSGALIAKGPDGQMIGNTPLASPGLAGVRLKNAVDKGVEMIARHADRAREAAPRTDEEMSLEAFDHMAKEPVPLALREGIDRYDSDAQRQREMLRRAEIGPIPDGDLLQMAGARWLMERGLVDVRVSGNGRAGFLNEKGKALIKQLDEPAAPARSEQPKPPRLAEGMTARFSRDLGYASKDTDYEVTKVERNGRVHLRNKETGSGTTLAPYEISNAVRAGTKIDTSEPAEQEAASAPAPTQQAARDRSSGDRGASPVSPTRPESPGQDGTGEGEPAGAAKPEAASDAEPAAEPAPQPPTYGADNKLVSRDRAAELRRRLRDKMNQLNAGIDPETLALFTELGVFHIEAGARRFADFAKAIVADLGVTYQKARPFLRSAYNGARDMMEDHGQPVGGMDSPDQVRIEMAAMYREGGIATREEAGNGLQDGIRPSDEGPRAEVVQQPAQDGRAGRAGAEGERAGALDASRPDERAGQVAERPAAGQRGVERGRASGDVGPDRLPSREPAARRGRRDDPATPSPERVTGQNWRIEPDALAEDRSPAVKARDNIRAVEIIKAIDAEQRLATREEQAALARYVGWGGLKNAFPRADGSFASGFDAIGPRLRELLNDDEYETARRSIQYAHYTSEKVVRPMWDAARHLGFEGGKVFEPGMGTGNFLGMMPADLAARSQYQGIEYDATTARIAELLYPQSGVRQDDYTRMAMPPDTFDLVIGNPPFSETVIRSDPAYRDKGMVLHDFFFAKSLDAVRPGGLLMFVTSAGTLNKSGAKAREYLADRADLVGAVRLPGNAFAENAGTSVTTDIVILRKRLPGEAAGDRGWVSTNVKELPNREGQSVPVSVNSYFDARPDMVLGEQGAFDKLVSGDRYAVRARPGADLTGDLRQAIDKLPGGVMKPWQSDAGATAVDFTSTERKNGSFYLGDDGRLMQQRGAGGVAVQNRGKGVEGGIPAKDQERIRALIPVRDALREVYGHDMAGNIAAGDAARARLNTSYEAFVAAHGPINKATISYQRPSVIQQETARAVAREETRLAGGFFNEGSFDPTTLLDANARSSEIAAARKAARETAAALGREFDEGDFDPAEMPDNVIIRRPNIDPFMDDQEAYRLRAIEHYNDDTGTAKKSAVFFENVITKDREPEINSPGDAFLYVLNRTGRVDLDEIAQRAGISRSDVLEHLGDSVFEVPQSGGQWQTREQYLSGNVRQKLALAQAEARRDPALERNVRALEAAQPVDLSPAEISAHLGMPWIPTDLIEQFGREALGLNSLKVNYLPGLAQWQVDGDRGSAAATTTWGMSNRSAPLLISDALNRTDPKITKTVQGPDGRDKQELDPIATQAAQDKVREIKQAFSDWIWKDSDRADQLATIYNRDYNNLVAPEYDGSYLTTPGISSAWSWRPHQKRVVARIIQSGNTYMAHAVGAGKTSAMIGAGMEMRRLGLVCKPMYAVPNHMLGQFTKEFYEQYPTAKIMVADERQFHTDRRKQFVANIAGEDLDAVIITHSAFGYIPISDSFSDGLIQKQIDDYRDLIAELKQSGGGDRFTQRRIEQAVESMEQKLEGRSSGKRKDQVFTFEETGIDFLFVDEAHLFRKLDFATKMGSVRGVDPNGSQMAFDLYAKTRYLETRTPGRSHVLASGTPITNTMAELYSLSRYQQEQALEERGIAHFDAWAGAYGDTVTALEQDPAGGYKPQTRFAKFVNVPELSAMVRQVMDVVTSKQLEQYVTRPKLKGGRRELVAVDPSAELLDYQETLKRRMKAIQERKGPPKKGDDILLSVIGDGRKAAIDMRLVDSGIASNEKSKLDVMIDRVTAIGEASKRQPFHKPEASGYSAKPVDHGPATQMIFSDLGINGDFPIHKYIANELVRRGFARSEVAIISDYKTHVARQRLFNDMNEGKVRVLIGSVAKMGTGVNAQRRLLALHNMDPQWYPANDEQRNGRALRQGNMNPEIEIVDYSTVGTYDSTMWGLMETKARFIEGFMAGDPTLRSMDDLGEASQYEQAKALTTSDPRILQLTEMRQDLERAERRADAFEREQYAVRRRINSAEDRIERAEKRIPEIEADIAQRQDIAGDAFTGTVIGQQFADRAEFGNAVLERMNSLAEGGVTARGARVGEVGGFKLVADAMRFERGQMRVSLYLNRNGDGEQVAISSGSAAGIATSVAAALRKFEGELEQQRAAIEGGRKDIAEFTPQLDRRFEGRAEIDRLTSQVGNLESEIAKDSAAAAAVEATAPVAVQTVEVAGDGSAQALRVALGSSDTVPWGGNTYSIARQGAGFIARFNNKAIGSNGATGNAASVPERRGDAVNRIIRHAEQAPKESRQRTDAVSIDDVIDRDTQAAIRAALEQRLRETGIADRALLQAASGLFQDKGIAGTYHMGIIRIALDASADPMHTLDHETIHALRDLGAFRPDEWRALERAAALNPILMADIRTRYPELDADGQAEEAVAEMYADYRRSGEAPAGMVAAAFRRIMAFFRALREALTGEGPLRQAGQSILDRIASGEIGSRRPTDDPRVTIKQPKFQRTSQHAFPDEIEERFAEARKGIADQRGLIERVSDWTKGIVEGFTRHFPALPNEERFSDFRQQLRKLEAAPAATRERVVRVLTRMVDGLSKEEYDLFSRKVILDDLAFEADEGRALPFGFTEQTLAAEKARIDAAALASDKVTNAIRQRKLTNERLADEMVAAGILSKDQVKNPAYYRHQVLEYARLQQAVARGAGTGARLRSPVWARRKGSALDINANLLEAEFDWMQKAFNDIETAKTIDWIKRSDHNVRDDLIRQANDTNRQSVEEAVTKDERENGSAGEVVSAFKGFRQRIAIGMSTIRAALEDGTINDVPKEFERAADDIVTGRRGGEPPFGLLSWMLDNNKPGALGAASVLKAIGERRAWTKALLGERYLDPMDVESLVRRIGPEGHVTWQPDEGKLLFTAKTIPEHIVDGMIAKLTASPGVDGAVFADILSKAKSSLIVGGDKYQMVLPQEMADTLNQLRDPQTQSVLDEAIQVPLRAWKRWVLINPRRVIKYNVNNLSGDLDAVIAGNPQLLRQTGQAARELASVMRGKAQPSARYQEAVDRGVFESGLSVQEIPDINSLSAFSRLAEAPSIAKSAMAPLAAAWRGLQGFTTWRENVFRYAAYLNYVGRLEAGEDMKTVGYGASIPSMVDAVVDIRDKAAMLARDLVGDYGDVSTTGRYLRSRLLPFYSWLEVNTRRYWRLSKNAYSQGIGRGIATSGGLALAAGARRSAWLAIRMAALFAGINAWNMLFHHDEEKKLSEDQQRQLHVILGTWDGEVVTLRTQGALSDALSWFGYTDVASALHEINAGRGSYLDIVKAVAKAPVNKIVSGTTPLLTQPLEAATGKSLWPDAFAAKPIRDGWRNFFSTFSMENEYDAVKGKPTRGYLRSWIDGVTYSRDPGEIAYDESRGLAYNWLARVKGQEGASAASTPRSDALYDYRRALRYGDENAADAALNKMGDLGMKAHDLSESIKHAAPLGPIAKKDRAAFVDSLTDEEFAKLQAAQDWYQRIYK